MFGVYAVLTVAGFVASVVAIALTNPHLLAAYATLDPQALTAVAQEQMARQGSGRSFSIIAQSFAGSIAMTLMGAVFFGAIATAAIELQDGYRVDGKTVGAA